MIHGTYKGDNLDLKGEKALLQDDPEDAKCLLAQFDNWDLGTDYSHSWTSIPRADFEIDEPVDWGDEE